MRYGSLLGSLLAACVLQGCAGTPAVLAGGGQKALQSLQIFGQDARPRFSLYLRCDDRHGSCAAAENAFSNWARSRHIRLELLDPADGMHPAHGADAGVPYRMTIRLTPVIIPSYDESGGVHGDMRGGYTPPRIGYSAKIDVFDGASGKLLFDADAHDQQTGQYKSDANAYIRAQMATLIGSLDPGYARP